MIEVHFIDVEIPGLDSEFFGSWLSVVCEQRSNVLGDVNLIFCSDEHLLEMNKTHLNHDYYTDIITFDYCEGGVVNGDLFISKDRVLENSNLFGVDFVYELNRVVAHGVLHLLGLKDKSEKEAAEMRLAEEAALSLIVPRETI